MKILITGGAGFIGSNLAEFHIRRGDQVVAVDDLSTGREENLKQIIGNPNFSFIREDFTRSTTWQLSWGCSACSANPLL